jgi:hypothetical protein
VDPIGLHTPVYKLEKFILIGLRRKLHKEKCQHSSPKIIKIMTPRRLRCAGYVVRMGKKRNAYRVGMRKPDGRDY